MSRRELIAQEMLHPAGESKQVGEVFGTPLTVIGKTWLPLIQVGFWAGLAARLRKKYPDWPLNAHVGAGGLSMLVMLGSEWAHNLAHAAGAQYVGKPVGAVRINYGMPLLRYSDVNDPTVTPRQHIARSLGGPLFNLCLVPLAWLARRFSPEGTAAREVCEAALVTNVFIPLVGLLPIPGLDGGPILKWSVVESGRTVEEADEVVRDVDKVVGVGLAAAGGAALAKRKFLLGGFFAMMSAIALAVGFGYLKEQ